MKVDRTAAPRLRVDIHLPGLTKGVGLDEVTFVMDVKAMLGGMFLEVGYEACDVNRHCL